MRRILQFIARMRRTQKAPPGTFKLRPDGTWKRAKRIDRTAAWFNPMTGKFEGTKDVEPS